MKTSEAVVDKICHILENCPEEWSYNSCKITIKGLFCFKGKYVTGFNSYSDLTHIFLLEEPEEWLLAFTYEQAERIWESFEIGKTNKLSAAQEMLEKELLGIDNETLN